MKKPHQLTELDQQLRELALTDWPSFVQLVGENSIKKAKICLMKRQNQTGRYMAFRTKMPVTTVYDACRKCPDSG